MMGFGLFNRQQLDHIGVHRHHLERQPISPVSLVDRLSDATTASTGILPLFRYRALVLVEQIQPVATRNVQ